MNRRSCEGFIKGDRLNTMHRQKNPKDKLVFLNVSNQLEQATPIRRIARENGISKSTVYEIKKRLEGGVSGRG